MRRTLIAASILWAAAACALTGCTETIAVQEHQKLLREIQAERAEAEAAAEAEIQAVTEQRRELAQEQEATDLTFKHRFENLGARVSTIERTHAAAAVTREAAFASRIQASERKVENSRMLDSILFALLGAGGTAVPGGAGIVAALRKARNDSVQAAQAGKTVGVTTLRNAIAAGRAADPEFDKAFSGPAGAAIKAALDPDTLKIVREDGQHKAT